jgi:stage III sporulation protein AG
MDLKRLLDAISKKFGNKSITNLIIVILILILALITISAFKGSGNSFANSVQVKSHDKNAVSTSDEKTVSETEVENKLRDTLELIDGVGRVEVMVYFEGGEEQVPAVNETDSDNYTEEKDNEGGTRNTTQKNTGSTVVLTSDGSKSEPLIIKTYKPKVSGVIIVAEGADDKGIQYEITKAVINLFNIAADKVNVYAMKK